MDHAHDFDRLRHVRQVLQWHRDEKQQDCRHALNKADFTEDFEGGHDIGVTGLSRDDLQASYALVFGYCAVAGEKCCLLADCGRHQ